jgi:DNA-binding SARP family transcriptional activator
MLERIVADAATSVPAGVDSTAVLRVSLFGRFRCEFGGVELPFERRREKNVLAYVALAASGGRTRDELIEAFWPGVPREIAAQNLRTALSRTRRALSDGLGGGAVERFFKTGNTIQLSETNTVIDVRRYTEHITTGKLEESRGDLAAARYHYATAEHLYGDGPLAGEPLESCFDEPLEALRQSHLQVLAKLVRLHAAASESEERRIYLMRLMNLAHDTELSESLLRATASTPDPS